MILLVTAYVSCKSQGEQQSENKSNLSFESHNVENNLDGWFKWGNYELSIDTVCYSGKYAGLILSDEKGSSFGSIAYQIPANYNSENIQLEG